LEKKRASEPHAAVQTSDPPAANIFHPLTVRFPLSHPDRSRGAAGPVVGNDSWDEAESLIRSGQVDKGISRMVQLSLGETTGRNRFQRRLLLAEACLSTQRPRLARMILEELAEQIDKLQLETWESSEMISNVWTRLFKVYKQSGDSDDAEKAQKLYERLCRLDPWQALVCGEG